MKKIAYLSLTALKQGLCIATAASLLFGAQNMALAQTVSGTPISTRLTVTLDEFGSASAGPVRPPTVQETLLGVCESRGYGEDCAKILLGMSWKESRNIATAIGDRGLAHGWFQIHYRMHGVSLRCAQDLVCSANWTIDYLEDNGYPKYVRYAVQCHNGCGFKNGYVESVLWNGKRLWKSDAAKTTEQVAVATR